MKRTLALLTLLGLVAAGCGKTGADVADDTKTEGQQAAKTPAAGKHDHSGWWCSEHGIPEKECSLCSASFAAKCKKNGDWCTKHNRADSQCFICHPERKEFYAKLYREKHDGKEPPKPEE